MPATPDLPRVPVAEHHDETDVPFALRRVTRDGKGDEDPGPSNFRGFATEGVEKEVNQ